MRMSIAVVVFVRRDLDAGADRRRDIARAHRQLILDHSADDQVERVLQHSLPSFRAALFRLVARALKPDLPFGRRCQVLPWRRLKRKR